MPDALLMTGGFKPCGPTAGRPPAPLRRAFALLDEMGVLQPP